MMKNKAAKQLGRLGGKSKSEAKASAVRENGKKGGRPKNCFFVKTKYYDSGNEFFLSRNWLKCESAPTFKELDRRKVLSFPTKELAEVAAKEAEAEDIRIFGSEPVNVVRRFFVEVIV